MANIEIAKGILETFTDNLAQGNKGESTVEEFDLDGTTLKFKVSVLHKKTIKIFNKTIIVYAMNQTIKGRVNIINPTDYDIDTCLKSPVGDICFDVDDLIKALIPYLV